MSVFSINDTSEEGYGEGDMKENKVLKLMLIRWNQILRQKKSLYSFKENCNGHFDKF